MGPKALLVLISALLFAVTVYSVTTPIAIGRPVAVAAPNNPSGYNPPASNGIAGTTKVTVNGQVHTYYLWKAGNIKTYNSTLPMSYCYAIGPDIIRRTVPQTEVLSLANVHNEAVRVALRDMIKAQKAPFVFDARESYWVDWVFDNGANKWLSLSGACGDAPPWGDACGTFEPEPGNPPTDYCGTFDMRGTLLCKPGDKCYDVTDPKNNPKGVYNPKRTCFYDGVLNNIPCNPGPLENSFVEGCIFESEPAPIDPKTRTCVPSGSQVPCPAATTPNSINNGGFEIGQYVSTQNTYVFPSHSIGVFGWVISAGNIQVQNSNVWASGSGGRSLALNAGGVPGVISQVVNLDRTKRAYTLNFQLAANPTQGAPANRPVQVNIYTSGGQVLATMTYDFDSTGKTAQNMGWQSKSLNWQSVDGEAFYTIEFKAAAPATGALGPVIDSVSLCAGAAVPPVAPCSAGTNNLISNPGFEGGNFVANSPVAGQFERLKTGAADITGWTVSQGQLDWVTNKFIFNDQNSAHSIHFLPGTPNPQISQTFTVPDVAARLYSLTFTMSGVKTATSPVKSVLVTITTADASRTIVESKIISFNTDLIPTGTNQLVSNQWVQQKVQFGSLPNIKSYVISITGTTDPASLGGALVDDFQMCEGPLLPVVVQPVVQCAAGDDYSTNGKFLQGTLALTGTGSSLTAVAPGYGDFDVLTPTSGQNNIQGWTVTGGKVLYASAQAWTPLSGLVRSVGILPGGSISMTFKVPNFNQKAYAIAFVTEANPWNNGAASALAVTVTSTVNQKPAAYSTFRPTANYVAEVITFVTTDGESQYTLTFTDTSGSLFGSVIEDVHICATADPTVTTESDFCKGLPKYLTNNYFHLPDNKYTKDYFQTFGVGNPTITNWTIVSGTVDHIYHLWQGPVGGEYSVDLSGNNAGAIQQAFTLPATAMMYNLKYALSANPDCDPVVKHMKIDIMKADGTVIYTEMVLSTKIDASRLKMNWVEKESIFTSVQGTTEYIVRFTSLDQTACGPVIGNAFICQRGADSLPMNTLTCNKGTTPNLVKNSGFEIPTVYNAQYLGSFEQTYANSPAIMEWSLEMGTVDQKNAAFMYPASGNKSIDMNGISQGTLAQIVNLGPTSSAYSLNFMMSCNPGLPSLDKTLEVSVFGAETGKVVANETFTWIQSKTQTNTHMEWALKTLPFQSIQGESIYYIHFTSTTYGATGPAIDDVSICGAPLSTPTASASSGASKTSAPSTTRTAVPVGASATSSPAPSSAPPPENEVTLTITADNTFELYVDGVEQVPAGAASISFDGACKGKPNLGPSKYCCEGMPLDHPRCNWQETETFKFNMKNSSILAVHVTNFRNGPDAASVAATNPLVGGPNPAGLLMSWTRGGRICGVTDSEWRCTLPSSIPAADIASGSWIKYDYNDASWQEVTGLFGANRAQAWVPLGAGPAKLYGGNSIWYSSYGQAEKGIADFAQWIWRTPEEKNPDILCRYYIPNLYC